jgi:hypothetical protein
MLPFLQQNGPCPLFAQQSGLFAPKQKMINNYFDIKLIFKLPLAQQNRPLPVRQQSGLLAPVKR